MINSFQSIFETFAGFLESVVFFNILFFTENYSMPLAIFFVLIGVIYFTINTKFINFRMLGSSVKIFFEKEKEVDGTKAVTSKAAFLSAISGCVGVGSISGVAAALFAGGPGAVFWMFIIGFLLMPLRYAEVFAGHFFRTKEKDGTISQYGPYAYIDKGLKSQGYGNKLSKFLFIFYIISILFGSIGAFTMQVNPLSEIVGNFIFNDNKIAVLLFCFALATFSIIIVLGGLKRIIHTMEGAVSVMSLIYLASILFILTLNFKNIPGALVLIFDSAFQLKSVYGGILGTIIIALTRTVIATEVGLGTVSLLHGKSQSDDSAREGLLAMAGPFFANFIFITLNSIAVLSTQSHLTGQNGILMISGMFAGIHQYFPILLLVITFLFAFTTIVAWYFYGESSIKQITERKIFINLYRIFFFVLITVSGSVSFGVMIRIIDATVFSIVFPNIIALILLGKAIKKNLPK
jgi:AGCS family alanine or glycine:cation symporter